MGEGRDLMSNFGGIDLRCLAMNLNLLCHAVAFTVVIESALMPKYCLAFIVQGCIRTINSIIDLLSAKLTVPKTSKKY
jgi:hypothetical protein